jgi:hypothetical protein
MIDEDLKKAVFKGEVSVTGESSVINNLLGSVLSSGKITSVETKDGTEFSEESQLLISELVENDAHFEDEEFKITGVGLTGEIINKNANVSYYGLVESVDLSKITDIKITIINKNELLKLFFASATIVGEAVRQ